MSRKLATADAATIRLSRSAPLSEVIHGVLFDLCNVLFDDTVWRQWVLCVLAQLGLHTNYRSFFHIRDRDHWSRLYRNTTMIAFYQLTENENAVSVPRMRRAHRMVASRFLTQGTEQHGSPPPVAAWKSWLFAAWVVVVASTYFLHLCGVL